jgi:Sec-independent protein translocase protein TatA
MEILGVGWQEFIFILIIALIVLGPNDMRKAGGTIGRWLNQIVKSDGWKAFQQTTREIQNLPRNLMRQANMEMQEMQKDINKVLDPRLAPPASPPGRSLPPSIGLGNPAQPASVNSNAETALPLAPASDNPAAEDSADTVNARNPADKND